MCSNKHKYIYSIYCIYTYALSIRRHILYTHKYLLFHKYIYKRVLSRFFLFLLLLLSIDYIVVVAFVFDCDYIFIYIIISSMHCRFTFRYIYIEKTRRRRKFKQTYRRNLYLNIFFLFLFLLQILAYYLLLTEIFFFLVKGSEYVCRRSLT